MNIIIHINTFYSKYDEENKLNILDKLEDVLGYPSAAKQIYEDEENESEGFDVLLKYEDINEVPFDLMKELGNEFKVYFLVFDIHNSIRYGYWYDEEDEWIEKGDMKNVIEELNTILLSN